MSLALHGGARSAVADKVTDLDGTYENLQKNFAKPNWSKLLNTFESAKVIDLLEQEMLDGGYGYWRCNWL